MSLLPCERRAAQRSLGITNRTHMTSVLIRCGWERAPLRSHCLHCLRDGVSEGKSLLFPSSGFTSKRRKSKSERLYLVQDVDVVVFGGEGGVVVAQPVHHSAAGDDDGRKQRADAVFKRRQLGKGNDAN